MEKTEFDLIILGGGISASLMGISLMKRNKQFRVAIIENKAEFPHKIGESTSDITTLIFRELGIDHLLKNHSGKGGLRFLFNENLSDNPEDIREFASPTLKESIPGHHLNRKEFDESLLQEAIRLGVTVYRPAKVVESTFRPFFYELTLEVDAAQLDITSKRFLDATGRARFLKNKLNWKDIELDFDTGAISAQFKGLDASHLGSPELLEYWNDFAKYDISYSTTHFMRSHSWWWLIRLDDDTVSIGFVFDRKHFTVDDPQTFFTELLEKDPELSVLTKNLDPLRLQHHESLPYCSQHLFEDGASVIGDSGAFCDPFISPGLELICQQVLWLTELYDTDFKTKQFDRKAWVKYEKVFVKSFISRIELYKHWYDTMEYYDLMRCWLRLSQFIYFGFHTNPSLVFNKRLKHPLKTTAFTRLGFLFLRSRMNSIIKKRKAKGLKYDHKPNDFSFSGAAIVSGVQLVTLPMVLLFKWLALYVKIEFRNIKG